jgi:hypothetical protein
MDILGLRATSFPTGGKVMMTRLGPFGRMISYQEEGVIDDIPTYTGVYERTG